MSTQPINPENPPAIPHPPSLPPMQKLPQSNKKGRNVILIIIGSVIGLCGLFTMSMVIINNSTPDEFAIQTAISKTNIALPTTTIKPTIAITNTPTITITSTPTITFTPIPPQLLTATVIEATKQKANLDATETRTAYIYQQTATKSALYGQQTATVVAGESSYLSKAYVFLVDYADLLQSLSSGFSLAGQNPYYFVDSGWVLEIKGYLHELTSTAYKLSAITPIPQKFVDIDLIFNQIYTETQGLEYDMVIGIDNINVDALNRALDHMNTINDLITQGSDLVNSYN